jgi:hypothetical protein
MPQGAVASPLIANVYLHYIFDLWAEAWRKKVAKGDVVVVRYADDLVAGFQHRTEAERFLKEFRERLAKFGLELHPDKTRLINAGGMIVWPKSVDGFGRSCWATTNTMQSPAIRLSYASSSFACAGCGRVFWSAAASAQRCVGNVLPQS